MPTGLEEASAILTFVQVGFSLARTFTTLIGEYREAPDELATLANAIVDTLAHIETIKKLLEENETTHGWNANGIDLATSCLEEAERLVKRIVTLLRKSGADIPPNDRISPEDISISVLRRVAWSRFSGRIGKINESLAATRQKMLLILTLYRAFTVDSQEEQRLARDRVIVLVRGRQVQRARQTEEPSASPDESTKAASSPTVSPANQPADDRSTPTAVEDQSGLCVDKEQSCPPNPGGTTIENLVVTACAMDDAVLLQFGEAFNPPLTADQVRKLLQKAHSTPKKIRNGDKQDHEDSNMSHQHKLSSSREDLPQVDTDVGEDIDGAPRADPASIQNLSKQHVALQLYS
ncbi:hypothetical protein KC366_g15516 [Hortaea werneckii]|nr:hypothetical protein KC358_g15321 [Hortaea werneckii]KAI6919098.1 hypothetical protein KC341_g17516 [Hortaea werneckii]KAI7015301.1 hypothetical protein KC366_g15516 [Hortaea werneckii]KAI7015373.1 hypothetical protein KC362_g15397 [Hortaea werneckii]KAI7118045.1 hypothetical protein KC337_g15476 [Hortaea werneckii]